MVDLKPIYVSKVFRYKGHRYKVTKSEGYRPGMSGFTYYIYAGVDPAKTIEETKTAFDSAGEFHGGVTYCHLIKHRTFDQPDPNEKWQQDNEYYEIGCDYAHLGDDYQNYTESKVCFDAEFTIYKLIEAGLLEDRSQGNNDI